MNIEKFIMDIKFNLMRTHYWYASVLMQMPVVYDDPAAKTFAVGKKHPNEPLISLFVCSGYVETIAGFCKNDRTALLGHFTEVLKHEVHHLVFGHTILDLPDRKLEKIACELSANSYIDRGKLISTEPGTPPGVFPEDFKFPPKLSAFQYYRMLSALSKKNNSQQGQNGQGQSGQGQGQGQGQANQDSGGDDPAQHLAQILAQENEQEQGQEQGQGQGQGQGQEPGQEPDPGTNGTGPFLDSHEKWPGTENSQLTEIEIRSMIRNANQAAREAGAMYGNMPGDLQTVIRAYDEDKPPVIPWEIVLRNFIASASETVLDYTMRRPSKRYGTRPGTKKEDILSIAIGIDTSGSITEDMIRLFFKELYWIEKTGSNMTVFEWDTEIRREYGFRDYDGTVSGGGGTDPTDFLETVSRRKYDCALIFTDLFFAPVRKDYRLPMMWIDTSDREWPSANEYPVQGTILKVNEARDGFRVIRT